MPSEPPSTPSEPPSTPSEPPSTPSDARISRVHLARTTVAALAAFLIARAVTLPVPYWATITALVVMQSSLVASWTVSWKRLVGTATGAILGGALATLFPPSLPLFAAALLVSGGLLGIVGLDRVAYRFTGITLAIIMLVPRSQPAWITATHRFAEVSIGIAVALAITVVWPERATILSSAPGAQR